MSAAIAICHDSDREVWLEERKNGLGGSDAPAVLALEEYNFGGPAKIAAVKLGYELGAEDEESELMKWGRHSEPIMLSQFKEETGIEGTIDGNLYRSTDPDLDFMQATLDARCVVDGVEGGIECKLARFSADNWKQGVPKPVNVQVQHSIKTMGFPWSYVLVLLNGYQFRWARVDRDDRFIDEILIPTERAFWEKIQSGELVRPVGAPDAEYEGLKAMFKDVVPDKVVRLEGDAWQAKFDAWRRAGNVHRRAEKRYKALRNEFFAEIGDAEYAQLDSGQLLTLRSQTRAAHEVRESTFRVLRASKG